MEVWTRIDAPIQAFTTFKLSCVRYHRRSASDYEPTQFILIGLLTVSLASCHKTPEGSKAAEAVEAVKEAVTSNADAVAKDLETAQAAAEKKAAEKEAAAKIKAALTPAPSPAPAAPPATPAVPK